MILSVGNNIVNPLIHHSRYTTDHGNKSSLDTRQSKETLHWERNDISIACRTQAQEDLNERIMSVSHTGSITSEMSA